VDDNGEGEFEVSLLHNKPTGGIDGHKPVQALALVMVTNDVDINKKEAHFLGVHVACCCQAVSYFISHQWDQ
jgi:hypothetical protein